MNMMKTMKEEPDDGTVRDTGATVSFYYYMYGADMDTDQGKATLTLAMRALNASTPTWVDVVQFTGQQQTTPGSPWLYYKTLIDSYLPATPTASAPMAVQFKFR